MVCLSSRRICVLRLFTATSTRPFARGSSPGARVSTMPRELAHFLKKAGEFVTLVRVDPSDVEAVHLEFEDDVYGGFGDFLCSFGDHRCSQGKDFDVEASRFGIFFSFLLFGWRQEIRWLKRSSPWNLTFFCFLFSSLFNFIFFTPNINWVFFSVLLTFFYLNFILLFFPFFRVHFKLWFIPIGF